MTAGRAARCSLPLDNQLGEEEPSALLRSYPLCSDLIGSDRHSSGPLAAGTYAIPHPFELPLRRGAETGAIRSRQGRAPGRLNLSPGPVIHEAERSAGRVGHG